MVPKNRYPLLISIEIIEPVLDLLADIENTVIGTPTQLKCKMIGIFIDEHINWYDREPLKPRDSLVHRWYYLPEYLLFLRFL